MSGLRCSEFTSQVWFRDYFRQRSTRQLLFLMLSSSIRFLMTPMRLSRHAWNVNEFSTQAIDAFLWF